MGKEKNKTCSGGRRPNKHYDKQAMEQAVRKVLHEEWTFYKAAKHFKVPWSTLKENVVRTSEHFNEVGDFNFEVAKVGRPIARGLDMECKLAKYVIQMQELGFGLTVLRVRKLAYDLAKKYGSADRFNVEKGAAGKKWYRGFRERFNLTLRRPENLSRYRASCANPVLLQEFYSCLEKLLLEHDLLDSPHRIWNCDETGLMFVISGSNVVTSVGKKYIYRRVYAERGTTTTILCCASAAGKSGPFMVIFKGVQNIPALKDGADIDATVAVSPKGWITSELFLQWLKVFILSAPPPRPVLLLMDSHASHISPEVLLVAEENQIIILTFQSRTTHLLQPLDVTVFGSLKAAWRDELDKCMRRYRGKSPSRYDFHSLLNPSYEKSFTPQIIQAGFRKTGVFPFNRDAIAPEATAPAIVSNINCGEEVGQLVSDESLLTFPTYETPSLRTPSRKSQSAKVHTVSPTLKSDAGPSRSHDTSPSCSKVARRSIRKKNQCPKNKSTMLSVDSDDNSLCSICGHSYEYDVKNNTCSKWIQCCFCLQWYHYECDGIDDEFDDGTCVLSV